jgi:hypothetical protein
VHTNEPIWNPSSTTEKPSSAVRLPSKPNVPVTKNAFPASGGGPPSTTALEEDAREDDELTSAKLDDATALEDETAEDECAADVALEDVAREEEDPTELDVDSDDADEEDSATWPELDDELPEESGASASITVKQPLNGSRRKTQRAFIG